MKIINGIVALGAGNASRNFECIEERIRIGMGFESIASGTLNVGVNTEYCILDDGEYQLHIEAEHYNKREWVKLKRCKLKGHKCAIIRPADHFWVKKFKKRIEIVGQFNFRNTLGLNDGSEVTLEFQGDNAWWNS